MEGNDYSQDSMSQSLNGSIYLSLATDHYSWEVV